MAKDDDDDDVSESGADERRLERTRKRVAARAPKDAEDEDDKPAATGSKDADAPVEIQLDDDDDDDDDEPARGTRKERRANRFREAQERAEAAEERARLAEERSAQAYQLAARTVAPQAPATQQPSEVDAAYEERVRISREYEARVAAKNLTQADVDDFTKRSRVAEEKHFAAIARRGQPQQMDPVVAHLQAVNHDVVSHPQAKRYAGGEFQKLLAQGMPNNAETANRAFQAAREHFRIGGTKPAARAPTASQRARYEGAPRGGQARSDGGGKTVVMTDSYKRMAEAAYPHIKDQKKAWTRWAKGPGRRLLDKAG